MDLAFHIVDSIGRLDLKGDGLPREGLDEDLHVRRSEFTKTTVSSSLFDRELFKELLNVAAGGEDGGMLKVSGAVSYLDRVVFLNLLCRVA